MSHSSGSSAGSSGFSGSSLLHLHRPPQLHNATPSLHVMVQDEEVDPTDSLGSSPSSSIMHSSTAFCPLAPGPSMKLDTDNLLDRPFPLRRASSDGEVSAASTISMSPERARRCSEILRFVQPSRRVAKPRSEWQPNADSIFCNHPTCNTMFGSTLSFGARRHHCRLCGLIFCNTHSSGRLPLQQGSDERPTMTRVCDGCFVREEDETDGNSIQHRLSDTPSLSDAPSVSDTPSLIGSDSSTSQSETLVDPEPVFQRSLSATAIERPKLAPIETWMDRSGVLSLYPLAVNSSHSRRCLSSPTAVGPLFAPSLAERRSTTEKEINRLSLRRRRNVRMWVSCHSAPTSDVDEEPEEIPSGTRTPQERELDWSTF